MWHHKYSHWWALQWAYDGWVSLGIHIDFRHRVRGDGLSYGPYVDIHFLFWILSLGNNPLYAGDVQEVTNSTAIQREVGFGATRAIDVLLVLLLLVNLIEVSYIALRVLGAAHIVVLDW